MSYLDDYLRVFDRQRVKLNREKMPTAIWAAKAQGTSTLDPLFWAKMGDVDVAYFDAEATRDAARHYWVAWMFGDCERQRALMLWKLQHMKEVAA